MTVEQQAETKAAPSSPSERGVSRAKWKPLLSSGATVVSVACAAAYTSREASDKGVAITAWVAVAVVGTASMIAAARN